MIFSQDFLIAMTNEIERLEKRKNDSNGLTKEVMCSAIEDIQTLSEAYQ